MYLEDRFASENAELKNDLRGHFEMLGEAGKSLYEDLASQELFSKEKILALRSEFREQFQVILEAINERKKMIKNLKEYVENSKLKKETDPRSILQFRTLKKIIEFLENGGSQ